MIYEFQATQDLHGYDKPWVQGAMGNLFDESTVTFGAWISGDGTSPGTANYGAISDKIVLSSGKCYVKAFGTMPNAMAILEYAEDDTFIKRTYVATSTAVTATLDENTAYVKMETSVAADKRITEALLAAMKISVVDDNSAPAAYYPYSNICPPEGFNIWDPDNAEYVQVYSGYVNANTRELYLRPVYKEYAGEELVGPWMSSLDPYEEDTTPTEGAFVIDFGGELESFEITPFMLQTLLDSLGIRQHFTNGAGLLNSLMDQAQGRVRSEEELLHLSRPLKVIAIGDQLPAGITFKPISKDVLPGLPGKFIR